MENILFLGIFFGFPILMVLALLWVVFGAVSGRFAYRRALASGWKEGSEDDVRALLRGLPALAEGRKVTLDRVVRRPVRGVEVTACRYFWSSKGAHAEHRQGRQEAWLVLPVPGQVPRAVVARRSGGFLDAVVDKVAAAAGEAPVELGEAWSWARVHGPGDPAWFTDSRGRALEAALKSGESLTLHDRSAILVLDARSHSRMLKQVDKIVGRLVEALH